MSNRLYTFLICLGLALACLAVFWQVRHLEFIGFDDNEYVYDNSQVKVGLRWDSIVWAFSKAYAANWHPLTWLSHMLDCELFGLNPFWHHLTNLLFHIANTLLLFWVFKKMTGALWPSAFVAAVFALHPLHVESVAWVAERKDILSGFFWMLTIAAYIQYAKRPGIGWYLLVVLALCLGLMTKPMVVTLPFVLLLLDYWPLARLNLTGSSENKAYPQSERAKITYQSSSAWHLIAEKIPLFIPVAVLSVIAYIAQQQIGAVTDMERLPIRFRISNALVSYISYITKMVYPRWLSVMYPHPLETLPLWQTIICAMILIIISFAVLYAGRQRRYLPVGWLWYLGTLVPVIGLVQVGMQAMADRYTYISLIGLFIIVGWGVPDILARLHHRKIILSLFAAVILSALGVTAWFQVRHWHDTLTVLKHADAAVRNNWWAKLHLGHVLNEQGEVNQAISEWNKVLQLGPGTPAEVIADAHFNLGLAAFKRGEYENAVNHLNRVPIGMSQRPDTYYYLGLSYYQQGKYELAIENFNEALRLKPDYPEAINNLGMALEKQGKIDQAIVEWEKVLQLRPGSSTPSATTAHFNLGRTMLNRGKYDQAIAHFNEALRGKSNWPAAYYYLGLAYAEQGKYEQSLENYNRAAQLEPNNPDIINQLGVVLEKQGKIDQAIGEWEKVLKLEPNYADAHFNLGLAMAWQKKYDDAVKHFTDALRARPDWAEAYYYLGLAYTQQGKYEQAAGNYNAALRIDPNFADAHSGLGVALVREGNLADAIRHYAEALRLRPDWIEPMNNLAWVLATAEDTKVRNPAEAIRLAERACELTKYEQPELLDTLAAAYAAAGNFSEAIKIAEKAIKLAESAGRKDLLVEIQGRLQLYKASQPYRGR